MEESTGFVNKQKELFRDQIKKKERRKENKTNDCRRDPRLLKTFKENKLSDY